MNNMIHHNSTTTFAAEFEKAARNHVEKLTFNTRDEYIAWVKQWKEDYKNLVTTRRVYNYQWKASVACDPMHVKYFTNVLKGLPAVGPDFAVRVGKLNEQMYKEYSLRSYGRYSEKYLTWYLLVIRRASKIRADMCYKKAREEKVTA